MDIDALINGIYKLPDDSLVALKKHIFEVNLPKGSILISNSKTEEYVYFIKKGIVRAFVPTIANDITFWFGTEGEAVLSMKSYVAKEKGYETIELLEDCDFYKIKNADLLIMYQRDLHIANWGRVFAEKELLKTEKRLISRQFATASERYKELLLKKPDLLKRVQLGYIASYLGITQVSLSRIRAEKK